MSMRSYGMETRAMVLTIDEFYSLLVHNRVAVDNINFDFMYDENNIPYGLHDIDYGDIMDIIYSIPFATWYTEVEGTLLLYDESGYSVSYETYDETLIIFELKNDDLFSSYNNFDEVYDEIINNLKQIGVTIDRKYVKEHFGIFRGVYIG